MGPTTMPKINERIAVIETKDKVSVHRTNYKINEVLSLDNKTLKQ